MTRTQRAKRQTQKNRLPLIITSLVLVVALAIGGVVLATNNGKSNSADTKTQTSTKKGASPKKVDTSENKVIESSEVAPPAEAAAPETIVQDTGEGGWVQVNSSGGGAKFEDLSTASLKVFKAHSPKVLKTATAINSAVMTMGEVVAKYPNSLIMNASGFNMETNETTGFQINNGQLFIDWNQNKRAHTALVINKDGSIKIYDQSTPASQILAAGADQSYSFGSVIIKDGQKWPYNNGQSDGTVNWMYHSYIGNDKDNNIYLMISVTPADWSTIEPQIDSYNLQNLIVMDGGGSSQMTYLGNTIQPSEDGRAVSDYIVLQ